MGFADIAAKVGTDKVYLGVVGGSVLLSVGHFLLNYKKLIADVPIHYDYYGRPDNYVDKAYFFLYPAMSALCGFVGYGMRVGSRTPIRASDQVPARVALATSMVVLVVCQCYAARISKGEARKMPPECTLTAFTLIGSCGLYSLLNGALNR